MLLIMIMMMMMKFIEMYFASSMNIMMVMMYMAKMNNNDWWMIFNSMSLNIYSYGLIIMTMWIFSFILMSLIQENNLLLYIMVNLVMMMVLLFNFMSMNLFSFYFMFETNLLMIFIMVLYWGYSPLRLTAAYYLMFYTLIFSLPLLVIVMYIYNLKGNTSFVFLETNNMDMPIYMKIYLIMSFMVKIPMYTLHNWLLKAHVEASYIGSMILASMMLKLGSYGLLRMIKIFKKMTFNIYIIYLTMMGSLMISLMCLRQIDMKIIVAMSSIVHMNLMIASMMTMTDMSIMGSYFMMLSHGLCSSGMFYLINIIYKQTNSRIMILNKGAMLFMPSMTLMWFLMCSSNMAAPMSLNLVSEIILLMCLLSWMKLIMIMMIIYCMLSFIYSMYLFSYIQHGSINNNKFYYMKNGKLINFFVLMMHWLPLNMIIFKLFLL
uniref:NADH-ubiquinone oxidoreductase chain 4 n=1 Tax=Habropoda radoszkowskii TaxID=597470 RepID=A0A7L8EZQ6_9HYME|nr:NADH dehydrogenase subunit 4 [Habropoda radoszkowskii]QOE17514.1 NADH dehydrogenase subunit 4 [Habropoda radoszkowskii]